jgi:hypothetical protein
VATEVYRTVGDESGVAITQADVLRWINDAQDEIVKRNRINKATSTASSVAGQGDYTFPTLGILQIESLSYGGQKVSNINYAEAEEFIISNDSLATAGTPVAWWEWGGTFTLWPTPVGIDTIKLRYTAQATKVTQLTDLLGVPDKYYQQVVDYAALKAYELTENWEAAQVKQGQFNDGMTNLAQEEREAQQMTYSRITDTDWM